MAHLAAAEVSLCCIAFSVSWFAWFPSLRKGRETERLSITIRFPSKFPGNVNNCNLLKLSGFPCGFRRTLKLSSFQRSTTWTWLVYCKQFNRLPDTGLSWRFRYFCSKETVTFYVIVIVGLFRKRFQFLAGFRTFALTSLFCFLLPFGRQSPFAGEALFGEFLDFEFLQFFADSSFRADADGECPF
jgi:hypothetical protein